MVDCFLVLIELFKKIFSIHFALHILAALSICALLFAALRYLLTIIFGYGAINEQTMEEKKDIIGTLLRNTDSMLWIVTDLDPLFFGDKDIVSTLVNLEHIFDSDEESFKIVVDPKAAEHLLKTCQSRSPADPLYHMAEKIDKLKKRIYVSQNGKRMTHHIMIIDNETIRLEHPHLFWRFGQGGRQNDFQPSDQYVAAHHCSQEGENCKETYSNLRLWKRIIRRFVRHHYFGYAGGNEYAVTLYRAKKHADIFRKLIERLYFNNRTATKKLSDFFDSHGKVDSEEYEKLCEYNKTLQSNNAQCDPLNICGHKKGERWDREKRKIISDHKWELNGIQLLAFVVILAATFKFHSLNFSPGVEPSKIASEIFKFISIGFFFSLLGIGYSKEYTRPFPSRQSPVDRAYLRRLCYFTAFRSLPILAGTLVLIGLFALRAMTKNDASEQLILAIGLTNVVLYFSFFLIFSGIVISSFFNNILLKYPWDIGILHPPRALDIAIGYHYPVYLVADLIDEKCFGLTSNIIWVRNLKEFFKKLRKRLEE